MVTERIHRKGKEEVTPMAIVNPTVTIRWQCTSVFGLLSGEVQISKGRGYRKEVIAKAKKYIREKYPHRMSDSWSISLFGEDGGSLGRWEVKL